MAEIHSVSNGRWLDIETWNEGIPTIADDVVINNTITIDGDVSAASVYIKENGSLIAKAGLCDYGNLSYQVLNVINLNIKNWMMDGTYPDKRKIHLRGVRLPFFPDLIPSISCIQNETNRGFLPTSVLEFPQKTITELDDKRESYVMVDLQPRRLAANLSRTSAIASGHNTSKWVSAGVASTTVKLLWSRTSRYDYSEQLDRMISQPFEVLLVSHTGVMKGHIVSKDPVPTEGSAFFSANITIEEGS